MTEGRTTNPSTSEVVEQLTERQIDLNVVRWMAGERQPTQKERQWLEQLCRERGKSFHGDLMFALTARRYPHDEADQLWHAIVNHRDVLSKALARDPGIVVAALDYLSNSRSDSRVEYSIIERRKLDNMLERAVVDGLTGLYDHDTLLTLLDKEIDRAKRHREKVSLLLLDLDDFKEINDEFGHQKGDEVLLGIAETMRATIRTMDIAGRCGGEEFCAILPETDLPAAVQSAERLRKAVEDRFRLDVQLTISVGAACYPDHGERVGVLVKMADDALYRAKATGKNQVITAT